MSKSHKLLKYGHKAVWLLLSLPLIWTNIAYRHDEVLYKQYDECYKEDINMSEGFVKDKGIVVPMDLFDAYNCYLLMPTLIAADKETQLHVLNSYFIAENSTKQEAILQLDNELQSKWNFVYDLNDTEFWGIPRDTRLFTLSARILDTSFRDTETWDRVRYALTSSYIAGMTLDDNSSETGVFDAYKVYANELGYTNIDIPAWESMMWSTLKFYMLFHILYLVFVGYSLISIIYILIRKYLSWRDKQCEEDIE